jgi:hypothetical protein
MSTKGVRCKTSYRVPRDVKERIEHFEDTIHCLNKQVDEMWETMVVAQRNFHKHFCPTLCNQICIRMRRAINLRYAK